MPVANVEHAAVVRLDFWKSCVHSLSLRSKGLHVADRRSR
jgi:hypothetical protein